MIYPIVKFGDPVLEKSAAEVTTFDDNLKKLIEDMFESMYAARGVGLAAAPPEPCASPRPACRTSRRGRCCASGSVCSPLAGFTSSSP